MARRDPTEEGYVHPSNRTRPVGTTDSTRHRAGSEGYAESAGGRGGFSGRNPNPKPAPKEPTKPAPKLRTVTARRSTKRVGRGIVKNPRRIRLRRQANRGVGSERRGLPTAAIAKPLGSPSSTTLGV